MIFRAEISQKKFRQYWTLNSEQISKLLVLAKPAMQSLVKKITEKLKPIHWRVESPFAHRWLKAWKKNWLKRKKKKYCEQVGLFADNNNTGVIFRILFANECGSFCAVRI